MRHFPVLFVAGLSTLLPAVFADWNVTVDDSDPAIQYSDGWTLSAETNPLNFGGFHHLSDQSTATATFIFTGEYFPH